MFTHTHINTHTHTHTNTHAHVFICTHTHTCTRTHTCSGTEFFSISFAQNITAMVGHVLRKLGKSAMNSINGAN